MSDSEAIEPTTVQTGGEAAAADGGNLPAHTNNSAPARPTFGGFINTIINFLTLSARFIALAAAAAMLKEHLHRLQDHARRDAATARRVAEQVGAAGADAYFVALYLEAAQDFDRTADCSTVVANAADQMEADARGVKDAHQAEYAGIYEVRQASPYAQPKPGFNRVR